VNEALRQSTRADVRTWKSLIAVLVQRRKRTVIDAYPYHLVYQRELDIVRRGRFVAMGIDMDWVVRLGREEWQRFTYERPEDSPLRLLGSVTRGAGMGALAVDEDGNYLQVNGDHVSALSSGQLRRAVAAAKTSNWTPARPHPARTIASACSCDQTQATGAFSRRCEDRRCLVAVKEPSRRAAVALQAQKRPAAGAGRRSWGGQSFLLRDQIRLCAPSSPSTKRA
jgi:hypothetical protein